LLYYLYKKVLKEVVFDRKLSIKVHPGGLVLNNVQITLKIVAKKTKGIGMV
jgi:hypothetical protein